MDDTRSVTRSVSLFYHSFCLLKDGSTSNTKRSLLVISVFIFSLNVYTNPETSPPGIIGLSYSTHPVTPLSLLWLIPPVFPLLNFILQTNLQLINVPDLLPERLVVFLVHVSGTPLSLVPWTTVFFGPQPSLDLHVPNVWWDDYSLKIFPTSSLGTSVTRKLF